MSIVSLRAQRHLPVGAHTHVAADIADLGPAATADSAGLTELLGLFTDVLQGAVPASGGGTSAFLRADGSWAVPAGGGGAGTFSLDDGSATGGGSFAFDDGGA